MTLFIGDVEVFRDPVHGFIQVDEVERDIINTKAFQRLRNISQLAFTKYVYHGAEHSRFGHSLGVMEFATKVFEKLRQSKFFPFKKDEEYRKYWRILRIAALLHDVGHGPFSHASDAFFPSKEAHENMSRLIIEKTEIGDIINHFFQKNAINANATEVADLVQGKPTGKSAFLPSILSGPFDVDKMDYLLRDSLYAGVFYGRFDWERLIHTFTLNLDEDSGNYKLVVKEGGVHAAEAMALARYYMFTQVYFHKVRRAYDLHLGEFFKELKQENVEFSEMFAEPGKFIEWDDGKILEIIRSKKEASIHAGAIANREHFKRLVETNEHPDSVEVAIFYEKYEKFCKEIPECIRDRATDVPYKYTPPRDEVLIKIDKGNLARFETKSKLVNSLLPINRVRVYVSENELHAAQTCWNSL
jgi:HD superfamily phosphohydrolase